MVVQAASIVSLGPKTCEAHQPNQSELSAESITGKAIENNQGKHLAEIA